jgi:hypothetical protein
MKSFARFTRISFLFQPLSPRASRILAASAIILSVFLFSFRWSTLGRSPFLNDEPRLQTVVDASVAQGEWPVVGPQGSQPIPYGPIPHWFYQTVRLWSDSYAAPHQAHAAVFLLAHLVAAFAVFFTFGLLPAALFLCLSAASPWLFVYSRMAWEVLLLVPGSAMIAAAWAILQRFPHFTAAVAGGVLCGLGLGISLGTHLMASSLAAAVALVWGMEWWRSPVQRKRLALFAALSSVICLAILWPYLVALWSGAYMGQESKYQPWGDFRHFWWNLVKTPMHLSVWQMKYFLVPQEKDFFAFLGNGLHKFFYGDAFGWVAKLAVWMVMARWAWNWLGRSGALWLTSLGAVGACVHLLLLQYLNMPTYPHYYLPFWWAPFLAVALLGRNVLGAVFLGALVTVNLLYLERQESYLLERQGTRGDYYGTFLEEQRRFVADLCESLPAGEEARIDLSQVRFRHYNITYFANHLEECRARALIPSEAPITGNRMVIRYADQPAGSAGLNWVEVRE